MKSKRLLGALATTACAMIVAPMVTGAAAHADDQWPSWEVRTSHDKWDGYGKFDHEGDRVLAGVQEPPNGWTIAVVWETNYGRSGICADKDGVYDTVCNYNLAERGKIRIQACLTTTPVSEPIRYSHCGAKSNWVSIADGTGWDG